MIGQIGVTISPLVKVVFFDLFLFATGYKVGPQFFRGLGRSARPGAADLVLCVTSLATTVIAAMVMGYDCGTAAGLMAGAFTESTIIGTAGDAIGRLPVSDAEKTRFSTTSPWHMPSAIWWARLCGVVSLQAWRRGSSDSISQAEGRALEAVMTQPKSAGNSCRPFMSGIAALTACGRGGRGKRRTTSRASFAPARVFIERLRRDGMPRTAPDTCSPRATSWPSRDAEVCWSLPARRSA